MEIRELRYFVQIAKDQSFTLAAEHLFVSQPALSKMMKKFSQELGVQLFESNSTGTFLTDYGKLLYLKAQSVLEEFDSIPSLLIDSQYEPSDSLHIGASPIIGELFLVGILSEFKKRFPKIDLQFTESGSKTICHDVFYGKLDLGVCLYQRSNENLDVTSLFLDRMVICVSKENPLAQHNELSIASLSGENFNSYSPSSSLSGQIISRCAQEGFQPNITFTSSNISVLLRMTASNQGICILPRPYALNANNDRIKIIEIKDGFLWEGSLVQRQNSYRSRASHLFVEYLKEYFRSSPYKKSIPFE